MTKDQESNSAYYATIFSTENYISPSCNRFISD